MILFIKNKIYIVQDYLLIKNKNLNLEVRVWVLLLYWFSTGWGEKHLKVFHPVPSHIKGKRGLVMCISSWVTAYSWLLVCSKSQ